MSERKRGGSRFAYSVRLPCGVVDRMEACFEAKGITPHKKVAWVEHQLSELSDIGVENLVERDFFCVGLLEGGEPYTSRTFRFSDEADALIRKLLISLRLHDPLVSYSKSQVIRAAIMFGLDRCRP